MRFSKINLDFAINDDGLAEYVSELAMRSYRQAVAKREETLKRILMAIDHLAEGLDGAKRLMDEHKLHLVDSSFGSEVYLHAGSTRLGWFCPQQNFHWESYLRGEYLIWKKRYEELMNNGS